MSFRSSLVLVVALIGPMVPVAAITAVADVVLIRESDSIPDDLYAAGNIVEVRGTVEGDLIAAASQHVIVSGHVEGDVLAVAPLVTISGEVDGSVRALADRIEVSGVVGEDLAAAGRQLRVGGEVASDVLAFVASGLISGSVGRDVSAQALGTVNVSGVVGRDLEVNAEGLVVESVAEVGGDVRYRAEATISDNAVVGGSTGRLGSPPIPIRVRALLLAAEILAGLVLVLGGLAAFRLAPGMTSAAARRARNLPWVMLVGLVVIVAPIALVVGVVAAMSAGSPDLIGVALLATSPLAVAYGGLICFMLVFGFVPASAAVGSLLTGGRVSDVAGFVLGLPILVALTFVPVAGWWIVVALWLAGVGGWAAGTREIRRANVG